MSENIHIKRKVTLKEKQSDTHSDSPTPKKWPKIVIPIVAVAAIAVLAVAFWPKGETKDNPVAQSQEQVASGQQSSVMAEAESDVVSVEPVSEETPSSEGTAVESNPAEPAKPQPTGQQKASDTQSSQTQPQASVTTVNNHAYGTLSGDVEKDTKAVIRGEFGNGAERKAALGNRYYEIQSKVNEFYRVGKIH